MVIDIYQVSFAMFYTLCLLLLSIATGLACEKKIFKNIEERISVFLLGTCFMPIVISIWMMIISIVPSFRGKRYLVMLLPLLASIIYIVKNRTVLNHLIAYNKRKPVNLKDKILIIIAVFILLIAFVKIWIISCNARVGQDANFYLAESLKYAKTLNIEDIATHRDYADGSLQGSPHNFAWPAYMSYALLFSTKIESIGHDLPAILSMRYTMLYLLLALGISSYIVFQRLDCSVAAMALYLLTPYREYLFMGSRDFYRMIPLTIIIAMFSMFQYNKRLNFFEIFVAYILGFFTISGHPINMFWVPGVGIGILLTAIIRKDKIGELSRIIGSYIIGILTGSYNIIYALIDTGDLSGKSSLYSENIFKGTEIETVYINRMKNSMASSSNPIEIFKRVFAEDANNIVIVGLICSVFVILFLICRRNIKANSNGLLVCVSNFVCISFIYVTGFFKWGGGFDFAGWLSRNSRYGLHYYVLSIYCIIFVINLFIEILNKKSILVSVIASILIPIFGLGQIISMKYSKRLLWEKEHFETTYLPVIEYHTKLNNGNTIIVPGQSYPYLINLDCKMLTSYFGVPIFRAEGEKDILNYFKETSVQYICMDKYTTDALYKDSKFYGILKDSSHIITCFENDAMEIFEVKY